MGGFLGVVLVAYGLVFRRSPSKLGREMESCGSGQTPRREGGRGEGEGGRKGPGGGRKKRVPGSLSPPAAGEDAGRRLHAQSLGRSDRGLWRLRSRAVRVTVASITGIGPEGGAGGCSSDCVQGRMEQAGPPQNETGYTGLRY